MDWFDGFDAHWVWLTLGLVLAGLEMLVPGVYLIWLALAAIVTGVLTVALDLSLAAQVIDFVFLSLILAFSAKRFLRDRPIESADPLMNRRGDRQIGCRPRRCRGHKRPRPSDAAEHHQPSSASSPNAFSQPNCTTAPSRHSPS